MVSFKEFVESGVKNYGWDDEVKVAASSAIWTESRAKDEADPIRFIQIVTESKIAWVYAFSAFLCGVYNK